MHERIERQQEDARIRMQAGISKKQSTFYTVSISNIKQNTKKKALHGCHNKYHIMKIEQYTLELKRFHLLPCNQPLLLF